MIFPTKSQNREVENEVFGSSRKFYGERPSKLDGEIFMLLKGHITGKSLVQFSPTDPDDISQSTPNFWSIFEF